MDGRSRAHRGWFCEVEGEGATVVFCPPPLWLAVCLAVGETVATLRGEFGGRAKKMDIFQKITENGPVLSYNIAIKSVIVEEKAFCV